MRLRIITVGKPRRGPVQTIVETYLRRVRSVWPTELVSVPEERLVAGRSDAEVMRKEAERIREKLSAGEYVVALDRTGRTLDSPALAKRLRQWEESAVRDVVFLIGGPVGLDREIVRSAQLRLSFGPMTFPHDLALVMLCEQVYRSLAITRRWPYHR